MSDLRERLAQMGETARAAAEPTFGGPWVRSRERHDGTAHVYSPAKGPLRQVTPVAETNPIFGAHIATFSPDVAAALVAVADALRNAYDVGAVAEWIDAEGDGPKAALAALAAALGVSR
mgnify:FL=1